MEYQQLPWLTDLSLEDWKNIPESESKSYLRQFLAPIPIGIALYNSSGRIIYLNQKGRSLLDLDRHVQLSSEQLTAAFLVYREGTQELYPQAALPSTRALAGETVLADDLEIHCGDRTIPLEVLATPIFDEQQVIYVVLSFQDISDRKRRQLERQILKNAAQSERRYRQVLEAQTDLILRSLPDTTITFANEALCSALGQSLQQVIGQQWSRFVPPEDLPELLSKLAEITPEQPTFKNVNRDYRQNNQIGWTEWASLGIFNERGQLVEIQSVGRDITALQAQIQREKALNRVVRAIRNSLNLEQIFATATAETARLLKASNCRVAQYLPRGVWRHLAEFRQNSETPTAIGLEIPDAGNPFAARLKQLQIVRVEDTTDIEDEINRRLAQNYPGAWLLIPLAVENTLWGCFSIATTQQPFVWNDDCIELARAIADQLEIAIQQANLYQQVQSELAERRRIETALRESEALFQNMAANVPGAICRYVLRADGSDGVSYMSSGCHLLWEVRAEEVDKDATPLWQMVHPEDLSATRQSIMKSARTLKPWNWAWRFITPSGKTKFLEGAGRPTKQDNGDIVWDALILDVSERQAALRDRNQAEAALRESEARYRLVAENINDLVCLHDLDGRYLYVSPACETLLGYACEEMLGRDPYTMFHPEDCDHLYREHQEVLAGKPRPVTYRMRHKSGRYIWFETLTKPIMDAAGRVVQLQTTSRDVTERVRVREQLRHDALHDTLTGLPNRVLLMERLQLAIDRTQRSQQYHYAILFLDLDRFKVINDSLGHVAGDRLLISVAQKLKTILRASDLAVRLGGDEFVVLLEDIREIQEVVSATERIFAELQTPLIIEGREVHTTPSVGIVLGDKNYTQASHLLRDADIAMYRAKTNGKARYEIFNREMHVNALRRLHLENDLRLAIEREELRLYYQPIIALDTGLILGFEALIRWQHPTLGLRSPQEFIAIAEETGMILSIDAWALQEACRQLAVWQKAFPAFAALKVSVNLSVLDLRRADLVREVDRLLREHSLNGRCLTLEITESMLIEDVEATIVLLSQLKARGIQVSVDDFGTGYSSLAYLHRLPIDSLKVDRSFVRQMQGDEKNHQIVEIIMALSDRLELEAIAEGIETQQQLERLRYLGYKFGQGYLFSKPLSSDVATALLASLS